MAEFDYINTPFGELEYSDLLKDLLPNFEAMMRGTKPKATANLANKYDVGPGTIETVYGADSTLGSSNIDPRYGIAYKDNNNLNADVIFNQDGRQANINAGLLDGNIYADYIKNINNNSTLNTGYQNDRGGFNITKDSDMGNTYAANLNVNPNTSLAFEKDDATKKLMAEYYPNSKSSLFAQAVNTDNGTGYGVGYNNKLTDNSNFKANFNRGPDKSYMAQLMLELGF